MARKIPGEFVPLDVNSPHDRAIRQAGPMAELLFYRSLMWARKHKTEGHVADFDLPAVAAGIPNPKKHATALVRERLWVTTKGGWHIRSWVKWNPTVDRAAQSSGGRLGNHAKWHTDGRWSPDCEFCTPPTETGPDQGEDSDTDRSTDRSTDSVPSIGVPIATESGTDRFGSQSKRESERESDDPPSSFSSPDVTRGSVTRMMPRAAR